MITNLLIPAVCRGVEKHLTAPPAPTAVSTIFQSFPLLCSSKDSGSKRSNVQPSKNSAASASEDAPKLSPDFLFLTFFPLSVADQSLSCSSSQGIDLVQLSWAQFSFVSQARTPCWITSVCIALLLREKENQIQISTCPPSSISAVTSLSCCFSKSLPALSVWRWGGWHL